MEDTLRESRGACVTYRKKLIEVALPLEAINREAAREKSIRQGHPSTLHLWWARRPLAACRAVLFASIVDDPSSRPEEFTTEEAQQAERERLFRIIEELVKWENSTNERVLEMAREEIRKATHGNPPPVLDPFCGGGSIPLEAQRLGLEAHASDLNPVAVLMTKALIEIPPRFVGQPPVNPESRAQMGHSGSWKGAQGLAEDIRYYGKWMRDEAERRIGNLYPKVELLKVHGGGEAIVIAWLWARTVKCPNPACGARMPLIRSFWLSTKPKRKVWAEPIVNAGAKSVRFEVRTGEGAPREGTVNRRGAECIVCGTPVAFDHIRTEGKSGRMSAQLMAIAAEGKGGRTYLAPTDRQEKVADAPVPADVPDTDLPKQALGFRVQLYGMTKHRDLFTPRQLIALTTFSDLVAEAREKVLRDAEVVGLPLGAEPLSAGGKGADAYSDAVATYLACVVSAVSDDLSSIVTWRSGHGTGATRSTFARQALPMVWDFAEANPFAGAAGDVETASGAVAQVVGRVPTSPPGTARQLDATAAVDGVLAPLICTDPPYYDNIGYADLSDYFYVWMRRPLAKVFPDLFSTLLTPKDQELVATPYRFGGSREKAEHFFENGLEAAFEKMLGEQDQDYPLTLFYAFKQAESAIDEGEFVATLASTGWETMLSGLLQSGYAVTGTWPMRSERSGRSVAIGTNALASSVVLVCRPRAVNAPLATRREFVSALRSDLPEALKNLQQGSIAPVDLAQAAIGPGMAVFSRYAKVLEADGSPMSIRGALGIINQVLDEVLTEQESEYDAATRWAVAWFDQYGMEDGKYGDAETLSKAKNVAVSGLVEDGFLQSRGGKVRLLRHEELSPDWDPASDSRLTVWEATHHLVRKLEQEGESGAAVLLGRLGSFGEAAHGLAYRLYNTCDRKKWAQEALAYNALIASWPEITKLAAGQAGDMQTNLGV